MDTFLDNLTTQHVSARLMADAPVERLTDQAAIRRAGVLVPLLRVDNEWALLFTRRTDTVLSHKGQVSFPGGMAEAEDVDITATALREAWEEIGLRPDQVEILGFLSEMHTVTDFLVTPVVGLVPWPFEMVLSENEVARVFTIPLRWLMEKDNWEERSLTIGDRCVDNVVFFKDYDSEVLWGVTARITLNLLEALQLI